MACLRSEPYAEEKNSQGRGQNRRQEEAPAEKGRGPGEVLPETPDPWRGKARPVRAGGGLHYHPGHIIPHRHRHQEPGLHPGGRGVPRLPLRGGLRLLHHRGLLLAGPPGGGRGGRQPQLHREASEQR